MEKSKITLFFCLFCISLSSQYEQMPGRNGVVRHKKKVIQYKKPSPHNDRPSRQSAFGHDSSDYSATSEPASVSWKPITYSAFSDDTLSDVAKPTEISASVNGNIGHIDHTEQPRSNHEEPSSEQYQDYTLLQYYIPFEQIISHAKPITEPPSEHPPEAIKFEKLNKAAVEPVTVFKKENEGESHSENDDDFTGRYEYEYFVQDDHWGTNFGHKEYRDGKHTKGDYEVALPDGRVQHVKYWSDASGYHASVTYHPLFQKYKHQK